MPVREVLRQLEVDGLVEYILRKGVLAKALTDIKRHSKVPTFGQAIPHLLLSLPDLVSAIYDSGITFFSSTCIYSRSL
jgi:DNA-binding FadR family transcriptional regulator